MWLTTRTGTTHHAWRLHTHFELDKSVPLRMDLTDGRNSGSSDEKSVLRRHLQPDRCYVMDRWSAQFTLFNYIHRADSSYAVASGTIASLRYSRPGRCRRRPWPRALSATPSSRLAAPPRPRAAPTTPYASCGLRSRCTRSVLIEGTRGPAPATACCGSPPTCLMCRPRSLP